MQENWLQISQNFTPEQDFVLATIVNTDGSTYRKTGTLMLISSSGECTGLLSGGCLEADISLHAQEVLQSEQPQILRYDLKADEALLWGLGLGCDGAIDILLVPLTQTNNHLGFDQLLSAVDKGETGFYCQLVSDDLPAKAQFIPANINDDSATKHAESKLPSNDKSWLITPITPIVNLLICGAGPDVVPVVQMANQLGWRLTLQDHRQAHLDQSDFSVCYQQRKLRAENTEPKHFEGFDGVVIMTHNLASDGFLLKNALAENLPYIGLLGPAGRRDKLLKELSLTASDVHNQVFGPIGLDIGGRSPQAIALSICGEIQQQISQQYSAKRFRAWRT